MAENDYVIVVHGTWNPPHPTSPRWHQLQESNPENFCTRLNTELEKLGLGRAVWRRRADRALEFGWDATNSHEGRIAGGKKLLQLVQDVLTEDPDARIHFVAHSHGASVVLVAIQGYLKKLAENASTLHDSVTRPGATTAGDRIDAEARRIVGPISIAASSSSDSPLALLEEQMTRPDTRSNPVARRSFVTAWMQSRATNRIGRVVTLGGPFLHKAWHKRSVLSPSSLLGSVIDLVFAVLLAVVGVYVWTMLFWTVHLWLIGSVVQWMFGWSADLAPVFDPRSWPTWAMWTAGGTAGMAAFAMFTVFEGWKRHDTNLYFNPRSLPETESSGRTPMPAVPYDTLVVHGGLLDEALLGFSAEPLVFGTLLPQIRALLRPRLAWTLDDLPIGRNAAPRSVVTRFVAATGRLGVASAAWLARPVVGIWERYLTTRLLHIVASPAFGVPAREFSSALIQPLPSIGAPDSFTETRWDVGRLLLDAPRSPQQVERVAGTAAYSFLWEEEAMQLRLNESPLWRQLGSALGDIERRHLETGAKRTGELRDRLARIVLVLEQKTREVLHGVSLLHCAYYEVPAITVVVAEFIANGNSERLQALMARSPYAAPTAPATPSEAAALNRQ